MIVLYPHPLPHTQGHMAMPVWRFIRSRGRTVQVHGEHFQCDPKKKKEQCGKPGLQDGDEWTPSQDRRRRLREPIKRSFLNFVGIVFAVHSPPSKRSEDLLNDAKGATRVRAVNAG